MVKGMDLESASRADLVAYVGQLQAQIAILTARVKDLEDRLAQDSHNSSKPPSSDPPGRRTRSMRQRSGQRPGGQVGHAGHALPLTASPDRVVVHRPASCARCGADLTATPGVVGERRQVVEVPPLRPEVVEHRSERVGCPRCGRANRGAFPAAVTRPVQYGPRMQALGVYLRAYQLLPAERACEVLTDLFGAGPSVATQETAVARCAQALEPVETAIKAALRASPVAHFDETGFAVEGRRRWLHTASTATLTYYAWHVRRGKAATDALAILPHFRGRAVHDAWGAYFAYPGCRHALCNAHHLRELTFLEEQDHQAWAADLKALLREMRRAVAAAKARGRAALDPPRRRALVARYAAILARGRAANPRVATPRRPGQRGRLKQSKARNLLERLQTHQEAVLAFLDDFAVPFENSQAERDLRMVKVQQKISGGFRSQAGADAFCRIRGYLSTLRKQGQAVLPALQSVFAGTPLLPRFEPG
jgi:transposase